MTLIAFFLYTFCERLIPFTFFDLANKKLVSRFFKNTFPKFERVRTPRVFLQNMDIARKRAATKNVSLSRTNLTASWQIILFDATKTFVLKA